MSYAADHKVEKVIKLLSHLQILDNTNCAFFSFLFLWHLTFSDLIITFLAQACVKFLALLQDENVDEDKKKKVRSSIECSPPLKLKELLEGLMKVRKGK